jgi:hypothetical protein
MRNDGPDAKSWQTDSVAGPACVADVLRDGESFLENHESAEGRKYAASATAAIF